MTTPLTSVETIAAAFRVSEPPKVWAYVRVSTAKQAEEGVSLDVQIDAAKAYCLAKGLGAPSVVQEQASAGKPLFPARLPGSQPDTEREVSPRPLFIELLAHLTDKDAGGPMHLIVYRLDRLSRVGPEIELLVRMFDKTRVVLHSTMESEDQNLGIDGNAGDPVRTLIRQVLGSIAQYERALTAARSRAGMAMKASQGGWLGGQIPFGYESQGNDLRIKQDEAHIVRVVFELRFKSGFSYAMISRYLRSTHQMDVPRMKVCRILHRKALYLGRITDSIANTQRCREDLKILAEDPGGESEDTEPEDLTITDEPLEIPVYGR